MSGAVAGGKEEFAEIVANWHGPGHLEAAAAAYRALLQNHPGHGGALTNLGQIVRQQGNLAEALALYRQAAAQPDAAPETFFNLANAEDDAGHTDHALDTLDRCLSRTPRFATAQHKKGLILSRLGRWREAAEALRAAIRDDPANARIRCDLAFALQHDGAAELAEPFYRWAIAERPDWGRPLRLLGALLAQAGRFAEAEAILNRAIVGPEPDRAAVALLSELLATVGRDDEALRLLREWRQRWPDDRLIANALAGRLLRVHLITEALDLCDRSIERDPKDADAHYYRGSALTLQHRLPEALASHTAAFMNAPRPLAAISNYLFTSLYSDDLTPERIADEHRRLAAHFPSATGRRPAVRTGDRPIRIGYFSPDLGTANHPVAQFLAPVLAAHDRDRFHVLVYSAARCADPGTERLRRLVPLWRDIADLDDDAIVAQLERDRLDILVDLAGHTAGNGLRFLARRLAPVQVTYIGYPHSTGLAAIDYIIADPVTIPPEAEFLYTETVARPNPVLWCFQPPNPDTIVERPREPEGRIVFGSLNNASKLSRRCLSLWSRILGRCPEALLLLKAGAFQDPGTVALFRHRFKELGADLDRIRFEPPEPFARALGTYAAIDIALDTVPFNGGTTTYQALWMGVPVVTRQGLSFCQRMSSSLLACIGHPALIATTDDAYVEIACGLAHDPQRLADTKQGLRARVETSLLCDGAAYTRGLEAAYRTFLQERAET